MAWFDWIKTMLSAPEWPVLNDAQFGRVGYNAGGDWDSLNEGVLFTPVGVQVPIALAGGITGPSAIARAAFNELEQRYADLLPSIAALLREDYQLANPQNSSATDAEVMQGYSLKLIAINLPPEVELEIVLTYQAQWRTELFIDVRIHNWQAIDAGGYD
jgi:hypothetical protein